MLQNIYRLILIIMGALSAAIHGKDTFLDIYQGLFYLYNPGLYIPDHGNPPFRFMVTPHSGHGNPPLKIGF